MKLFTFIPANAILLMVSCSEHSNTDNLLNFGISSHNQESSVKAGSSNTLNSSNFGAQLH